MPTHITPERMCSQRPIPYWMKSIDMSAPHRGTREIVEDHREHEARDDGTPECVERVLHVVPPGDGDGREYSTRDPQPQPGIGFASGREAPRIESGERLGMGDV